MAGFPIFLDTVSSFLLLSISAQQSIREGSFTPVCWFFRLPCTVLLQYWDLPWLKDSPCPKGSTALSPCHPRRCYHRRTCCLGGKQGHRQIIRLLSLILRFESKCKQDRFLCTNFFPAAELYADLMIWLPAERCSICNYLPIDFCPKRYLFHLILFIIMLSNMKVGRTSVIF